MTESDWENEQDPFALLDYLYPIRGLDSAERQTRQSRCYVLACARRAWDKLPRAGQVLAQFAEQSLDQSQVNPELRESARLIAEDMTHRRGEASEIAELDNRLKALGLLPASHQSAATDYDPRVWSPLAHLVYFLFVTVTPHYRRISKDLHSVDLIHEIYGNPLRRTEYEPDWLDRNVATLARSIFSTHDFASMPILGDALQDAGCDNSYVLDHCRGPNHHVRGCWVVEGLVRRLKARGHSR